MPMTAHDSEIPTRPSPPLPTASLAGEPDIALAAAGDRSAFERLYRLHSNRVFSLCVRMVTDRSEAEELTQDIFVRAWEKLSLYRGESAFSTWLHRLAVNLILNHRKGRARRWGREVGDQEQMDARAGHSVYPGVRMDLEMAIGTLPPGARQVFVLHDVEGYKHEEIADLLGVTAGGCKAQLHRARRLLREALNR